jgi:hypothetical protein
MRTRCCKWGVGLFRSKGGGDGDLDVTVLMTRSDTVFEAWLGPGYRVTAQTNIVKPGGRAQQPHRDYREALHRYRNPDHR